MPSYTTMLLLIKNYTTMLLIIKKDVYGPIAWHGAIFYTLNICDSLFYNTVLPYSYYVP